MIILKYLIILIPIFMISCNNDNCDEIVKGESFAISDETSTHLSNYFNSERAIYKNVATGEEVVFNITQKVNLEVEYNTSAACLENPDENSPLRGTSEIRQVQIENPLTGMIITVQHQAALKISSNPDAVEQIFVMEGELNELNQAPSADYGLLVVTPTLSDELFTIKTEMFAIENTVFLNVEEINSANTGFDDDYLSPNIEVMYNKTVGIVRIKYILTNLELVFDRTE